MGRWTSVQTCNERHITIIHRQVGGGWLVLPDLLMGYPIWTPLAATAAAAAAAAGFWLPLLAAATLFLAVSDRPVDACRGARALTWLMRFEFGLECSHVRYQPSTSHIS